MKQRPNIVIVTSDQHRGDCFGFEGRNVKTPHLDDMAREGARFSTCITPNVVCQPARASILTGLLPLTHGVVDNGYDLSDELAAGGFAAVLARNGYKTGFVGKAHFSSRQTDKPTGSPECETSQKNFPPDWHGPYKGFDHVELMSFGHLRSPPPRRPLGLHYEHWYYSDGRGEEKNRLLHTHLDPAIKVPQTYNSALPAAWHTTQWVADRTLEYIREKKEQPFCLWASFPDPHVPFDCPEPWSRLHHPDEIDLPPVRTMNLDGRPWWYENSIDPPNDGLQSLTGTGMDWSAHRRRAPDDDTLMALIANYYGMISFIDHSVGRIRSSLEDAGLADNTMVIFTSDHGEWLGDHGLLLKGPMLFDGLLRVGMLVCGPGISGGVVVDSPVSLVDVPETVYDYCGINDTPETHGVSLLNSIRDRGPVREYVLNEWDVRKTPFFGTALNLRTVRTSRYRLTAELSIGGGELYDLHDDPHEEINRYDDTGFARVRRELEDMLAARPDDELSPPLSPVGLY